MGSLKAHHYIIPWGTLRTPMVHHHYHHHSLGDTLPSWLIIISFHGGLYAPPWFIIILTPWGTPFPQGSSSYRHITSYRCGAETKSQKAQARYKYGPVFGYPSYRELPDLVLFFDYTKYHNLQHGRFVHVTLFPMLPFFTF